MASRCGRGCGLKAAPRRVLGPSASGGQESNSLNLRHARAVLLTAYEGEASFIIDDLEVRDVQTLRPDEPGTFSFWGGVNGIVRPRRR